MKEFMQTFKINQEQAEIAGVCAGLADYFGMKTEYMRLIWVLTFLVANDLGLLVLLFYAYLAGWLKKDYEWDKTSKKACQKFIFLIILVIVLPLYGAEMIETIYEFGRQAGTWLVNVF